MLPDRKGFLKKPDDKTQPARVVKREANYLGDSHEFNIKGKVTSNEGSSYHDMGKGSGSEGNYSDKDSSVAYLMGRGKKGQEINDYSNSEYSSRIHTNNVGPTAYNCKPIDQVYIPATSRGVASCEPVVYEKNEKVLHTDEAIASDKIKDAKGTKHEDMVNDYDEDNSGSTKYK